MNNPSCTACGSYAVTPTAEPNEDNECEYRCDDCGEYFIAEGRPTQAPADPCPRCRGRGSVRNDGFVWVMCPACSGKGR